MNRNFYFAFSSAALLLASCSNPLDKEFNRETAEADFTRLVKLGKVDSADASVMAHFMVAHNLIGSQVLEIGATYRDILGEAKEFWKRSGKLSPAQEEKKSPQPSVVTVAASPNIKKIQQSEWSSSLPYTLTISNISEKPVKAFKGRFIFTDAFGEPLHEVEYKYLNVLQPHDIVEQQLSFRILHIVSPNKIVQYNDHNPFTVQWQADSVITE